ncbi:polyhydroxybutyrate depolymerase [uncultured Roseobacter sp.]|uniref:alpha/beta hydrolase family esterase n=1 Tax=uncultured Roseobacter sp. TaxID=114847 RepID=UPI00260F8AE2|nr:polyhydroxybutyrate depolymerase [uncultured Roseobacter sp.]
MKLFSALLSALSVMPAAAFAMGPWKDACTGQTPCEIGGRSYHVLPPDGWDGETPMPVLLHFHGWQRQGTLIVRHQRISGATRRRGVLLVAPNGLGRSWDFWRPGTPDVDFARAVLKEVRKTWPVTDDRIYVSGYSWGSNMAWRFVCEDGADIAALLAVSGTLSQTEDCPTAPAEVRQVYGLNDQVLDFPFGPGGDTEYPVSLWREKYGCADGTDQGPWAARDFLTFRRTTWDCPGGHVSLDIHPGGHFIPHGWIARQLDEMLGLPPSYP